MSTFDELAQRQCRLDDAAAGHLRRLVGSWAMLADLSFSDLVLFAPLPGGGEQRFLILGQVRPATSQTIHSEDLVGLVMTEHDRTLVARAWSSGEMTEGEPYIPTLSERARVQCIPVRFGGRVLAVLSRESLPIIGRRPGQMERTYRETFDRFARMIARGEFPFRGEDATDPEEAPRVGDGVILLDQVMRIEFASPNAVSALHRMGISKSLEGLRLGELGIDESAVRASFGLLAPVAEEIERRPDVIVLLRCIPLLDGGRATGAIVMVRDVTQLRRLTRMLLSKDATIREVHHRVKNNLQTISSLLRLQARRLASLEGRAALEEAERRIRAIARVHEILSREATDDVPFDEILDDLVRVASDMAHSLERSIEIRVDGDSVRLSADVATPLAVVLQELLLNAVEHGYDRAEDVAVGNPRGTIDVLIQAGEGLDITVADDGKGPPPGFRLESTDSLGLQIVRILAETQLSGTIDIGAGEGGVGTVAHLLIPPRPPEPDSPLGL